MAYVPPGITRSTRSWTLYVWHCELTVILDPGRGEELVHQHASAHHQIFWLLVQCTDDHHTGLPHSSSVFHAQSYVEWGLQTDTDRGCKTRQDKNKTRQELHQFQPARLMRCPT